MEDDEQGRTVTSAFPQPPPFYEHFTPSNLARLQEIRSQAEKPGDASATPSRQSDGIDLDDLPPELRFLIPPKPPTSGVYRSFGEERDINETLPSLPPGIEQLFPHNLQESDRASQLLKITKSLLLNYLELVGALAANPELAQPKIDDLRTLFFNAHQLVNEYRPHQARETLITMMEQRLEQKQAEVEDVKTMRVKVDSMLAELKDHGLSEVSEEVIERETEGSKVLDKQRDERRRVWSALNAIEI